MLPLAHTYINHKLTGSKGPLLIFGGVLPDISTASGEKLPRDLLHNNPDRFYDFVTKKFPRLLPLALGAKLHSAVNHGADFYSDNNETGYVYRLGLQLVPEVAALLERAPDDTCAVLAHNFIEGGLDLNLAKNQPEILALYRSAVKISGSPEITKCLAAYFSMSEEIICQSVRRLNQMIGSANLASLSALTTGTVLPLIKIRLEKDVGAPAAQALLEKGVAITADSYLSFLDQVVVRMRRDFAKYLSKRNG